MNAPFIFILDIDGTLIGDISPQVMLYEMADVESALMFTRK